MRSNTRFNPMLITALAASLLLVLLTWLIGPRLLSIPHLPDKRRSLVLLAAAGTEKRFSNQRLDGLCPAPVIYHHRNLPCPENRKHHRRESKGSSTSLH